jgi:hypothetical protein
LLKKLNCNNKKVNIMNSDVMPSRVQMEADLLQQLVAEVKETIATGIKTPEKVKPSFGVVDLWKIQKSGRYATSFLRRREI